MAPAAGSGSAQPALPPGMLSRLLMTWRAPKRVIHAQRYLGDGALAAVLMIAMGLFFLAQLPVHSRAAWAEPAIPLEARIGGAFVAVMCILPLLIYGLAALVGLLPKLGGHGSRVALFWSVMSISPAMLVCGLAEGYLGRTPVVHGLQSITGLVFLWFWISGIRALWGRA